MGTNRIANAAQGIGGAAESAVGDALGDHGAQLGGRLRQAEGRAGRTYADARDAIHETAHDATSQARESYADAAAYAGEAYEHGTVSLRRGGRAVAQQVEARPLAALLVAGLFGYGLGLLVHRREERGDRPPGI